MKYERPLFLKKFHSLSLYFISFGVCVFFFILGKKFSVFLPSSWSALMPRRYSIRCSLSSKTFAYIAKCQNKRIGKETFIPIFSRCFLLLFSCVLSPIIFFLCCFWNSFFFWNSARNMVMGFKPRRKTMHKHSTKWTEAREEKNYKRMVKNCICYEKRWNEN